MKVVLACEGNSEVELLSSLLEKEALIFDKQDILDKRPIRLRQPKKIGPIINILPIDEEITFYRIGDTLREEFDTSIFDNSNRKIQTIKICTMPELEVLIIINEGKYDDFIKEKSNLSPKEFVKTYLKDISSFNEYITKHDMTWCIKEYKRIKKHKQKDENYLADLLK